MGNSNSFQTPECIFYQSNIKNYFDNSNNITEISDINNIVNIVKKLNKNISHKDEILYFDNNDLVHSKSSMSEYSRFNTKTKKAKHWYAQQMFNYINNNYKKDEPIKILVLGVALGSIIIDLLDNFKNANITGIDISDEFYIIVNFYSPKERLELIKTDAKEYVKNENIKYDVIICDIFDNIYLPDFVLDKYFLNNIYKKLKPNGKFLLNSIGISIDKLNSSLKDGFGDNCKITIIPRYTSYDIDSYNIVSFVNV